MDTHRDDDVPGSEKSAAFLDQLQARADRMRELKASEMTAGSDPVAKWEAQGMRVHKLPDDPMGILRISVGGCDEPVSMHYCAFRGARAKCIEQLKRAVRALESAPLDVE